MASPAKRICIAKITESTSYFDLQLRTTYPHNSREMNACLEITPKIQKPNKERGVGLIVLADISASMLEGTKLCNLIAGIRKTSELSKTLKPRFTLLTFNQETNVVYDGDVPPAEDINKICDALRPTGPTNIGVALQRAVELATDSTRAGQPTHILLFTDGEDMSDLRTRITDGDVEYVKTLRTAPSLFVHCVGICGSADFRLLDAIASAARRGTFQYVQDDKIKNVMDEIFFLMSVAVDPETYLSFSVDGETKIAKKDIMILLPLSTVVPLGAVPAGAKQLAAALTVVPLGAVPAGAKQLAAALTVGESSSTASLELAPRPADAAEPDAADDACALQHIRRVVADNGAAVAALLAARQFDDAVAATEATLATIKAFIVDAGVSTDALHHASYSFAEIHYCFARIADARRSDVKLHEAEGRFLTEACTARNNYVTTLARGLCNLPAQSL